MGKSLKGAAEKFNLRCLNNHHHPLQPGIFGKGEGPTFIFTLGT
jgi:hypothetical protein